MRAPVALATLLLTSGTGAAWVTPPDREPAVVAALAAPPREARALVPARTAPAGWRATQDRDTGVVAELWGGFVEAPGAVADPARAEHAARAFLARHLHLLAPGATLADLVVSANQLERGKRTVAFHQTWRGLRVVGGQLHVVFARDRLFVAASEALPHVTAAVPPRTWPSTARAAAWVTAQTGVPVTARATGERVVLPVVRGPGDIAYHVAERLDVTSTTAAPGAWDVYVAADGAPLLRASRLRFAAGTLRYDAGERRPTGPRQAYPAPHAEITIDAAAATTDPAGGFTWPGTAAATVVPGLVGTFVEIVNGAGARATAELTAVPDQPVTWSLATDELGDAQLSAYVHASIGKQRARTIVPWLASWLDQRLVVHVNESGTCNALSTGDDLRFFRGDPAVCENTARLADVVYHELGHSVHFQAIIPGAGSFNAALTEGLADFFAAHLLDDQALGRGFQLDDRPLRELDPPGYERIWPDDRNVVSHITGLIVSGALWDLRTALIQQHGASEGRARTEAVFAGVMQRAADIPGSYLAALVADDDDGDLGNGTPNRCAIEAAFGRHGLAGPGFATTTIGIPTVEGLTVSVPVTIPTTTTCPPPQVTGVRLTWRIGDGAPGTVELAATGTTTDATWRGAIPTPPAPALVAYQLTATLDDGATITYPNNLADPWYQRYTGATTEIWCERFDADPGWTQTGNVDWEWARPGAHPQTGDPLAAYTGTHVLGLDLTGDGRYPLGSTTSITTPAIDASSYDHVRLQYRRWLTVEDAAYDQATVAVNGTTLWTNATAAARDLHHRDREWRLHDLDVTAHAGAPLAITWALAADATIALGGWTLDDVCLVGAGKQPRCGDGILDDGETCDDGNPDDGDGCDATCSLEDAGCCGAGAGPGGPLVLALGVLALLRRRRR